MRKESPFNKQLRENWTATCKKKKKKERKKQFFYTVCKNKLKWIKDSNRRSETIKFLKETQAVCSLISFLAIIFGSVSSDRGDKGKNKQTELHQTKSFMKVKRRVKKLA